MKLVVFGANGPTGRRTIEMALAAGHTVTAVTRKPEGFPTYGPGLHIARADAMNPAAVNAVVAAQDAVISTLGTPYTKRTVTLYSQGTANIIAAMKRHRVRRLVCVSSMGTSGKYPDGEAFLYRKVIGPILLRMGRTVYEDMERMEEIIESSGLKWTVIRPAGLFDGDVVTDYQAEPHRLLGRFTSRTDLAHLLVQEATHDKHVGEFIDVVTTTGAPTLARMLLREALHIGK